MKNMDGMNASEKMDSLRRILARTIVFRGALKAGDMSVASLFAKEDFQESTYIGRARDYTDDLETVLRKGFTSLGVEASEIAGKTILLKVNLVETAEDSTCINTHPAVVRAAARVFREWGAKKVILGEGAGHRRDSVSLLEQTSLIDVVRDGTVTFVDLNYDEVVRYENASRLSKLKELWIPKTVHECDWLVSMPKLKTHHWTGVTLSMKNLFGIMPGLHYGWPKNVLHHAGLQECIYDIVASVRPSFAIVDGIVGMEGDGPIMGTPKKAEVLVMGRNLPAVDATCARVMGIDPEKVRYLAASPLFLGPIDEGQIRQSGLALAAARTDFQLLGHIEAQAELRSPQPVGEKPALAP